MTKTSECRLCLQHAELCDSHILPEFFFARVYDEKHRFYGLSSVKERAVRLFQKGMREKLLCRDCEGKLSVFEQHARSVLYGGIPITWEDRGPYVVIGDIDYKKLKLFLISLLWRLDVTTLPHFRGRPLPQQHRERLRLMLAKEDPGEPWEYGCTVTVVQHEGKPIEALITPLFSGRHQGHWVHTIAAGGFIFAFVVSSHKAVFAELGFLQRNGTLRILHKEITRIPFLAKFATEIVAANKGKQLPGTKI
jgi:hypothetical protein